MAQDHAQAPHGLRPSGIIVEGAPKFDLDTYISNYDGATRLDRLILIGTSSKHLSHDALQAALAEAKASKNVSRYLDIITYLQQQQREQNGDMNGAAVTEDTAWVDNTRKATERETERLESELKGYKNNLIKESIRMGNEELGAHYHSISDLPSAARAYTRMRDYCTTQKQLAERDLKLALLSISQHNFIALQSHTLRVQAAVRPALDAPIIPASDAAKLSPCIPPLLGLAALAGTDYRGAAGYFLRTPPAFISGLEPVAGGVLVNRAVMTPNDVATYGTLCALATYSRTDLRDQLLDSPTFRQFLELEPHLRRAVSAFVGAKYTAVLETLDAYRADYELDLHLQRHVGELWGMVRRKSILSFFGPFERVSVSTLVGAFGRRGGAGGEGEEEMVGELAEMIEKGVLGARLDLVEGVLVASGQGGVGGGGGGGGGSGERRAVHERALRVAGEQERAMRLKLLRLQMVECGFEVGAARGPRGDGFGGAGGGGAGANDDIMYDDDGDGGGSGLGANGPGIGPNRGSRQGGGSTLGSNSSSFGGIFGGSGKQRTARGGIKGGGGGSR